MDPDGLGQTQADPGGPGWTWADPGGPGRTRADPGGPGQTRADLDQTDPGPLAIIVNIREHRIENWE